MVVVLGFMANPNSSFLLKSYLDEAELSLLGLALLVRWDAICVNQTLPCQK